MRTKRNKRILALLTSVLLCLSVVATGLAATISVFASSTELEVGDKVNVTVEYFVNNGGGTPPTNGTMPATISGLDPHKVETTADFVLPGVGSMQPPIGRGAFQGWSLTADGTVPMTVPAATPFTTPITLNPDYDATDAAKSHTAKIVLYAIWAPGAPAVTHTVSYAKGAGDGTIAPLEANITGELPATANNIPVNTPLSQIAGYFTRGLRATGFTHTGWTPDTGVTNGLVTGDTIFTATWTKNDPDGIIKATFVKGNVPDGLTASTMPAEQSGTSPLTVAKPTPNPTLTGTADDGKTYEFDKWTVGAPAVAADFATAITANTTFTATWKEKTENPAGTTWTVTFDLNQTKDTAGKDPIVGTQWQTTPSDFSVKPKSPTTVAKGANLNTAVDYATPVAKSNAEQDRYEFLGWDVWKNGEITGRITGDSSVSSDLELTAAWRDTRAPNNGGELLPANAYSFNYNARTIKAINLPSGTTLTGVNLTGLYLSKDLTEAELKAQLVKKLNEDNRVRTSTGRIHTVKSVELASIAPSAEVTPRTITEITFEDQPTLDATNSWLVSFQSREGRFPNGSTQVNFRVAKGDVINPAIAPTWAGYEFLHWAVPEEQTSGGATLPNAFTNGVRTIDKNTTFIPVWKRTDSTPGTAALNVRFHANGGRIEDSKGDVHTSLTGPMIINMPKGTKLNNVDLTTLLGNVYPPANIVNGARFVGWSKTATNQTLVAADYVLNTNDENLYAMFKEDITVTLNAGNGTIFDQNNVATTSRTQQFPYGSTTLEILNAVYSNIVPPTNQVIAGLSNSNNGTQLAFDQRHNGNTTLYVVYATAITIAFDANGGSLKNGGAANEVFVTLPEGISLGNLKLLMGDDFPTVTPPAGKVFLGWSISKNYADSFGVINDSFVLNSSTTRLFASYQDAITVTFDAAPGRFIPGVIAPTATTSHVITTAKGTALNTVELPTVEAPTGKALRGWATTRENADKGITVPVNTTLDSTQTLYAVYGEPFLTLTFDASAGGKFEDGSATYTNNRVDKNTLLKDVQIPKVTANKEGYRLAGWATSPANAENGVLLPKDHKVTEAGVLFAAFEEGDDEEDTSSDDSSSDDSSSNDDDDDSSNGGSSKDGSSSNNGSVGVSNSNSNSTDKGGVGPKTGDNSMMMIGMIALILAGSGIAAGVVVYKKRKEQE